MPPDATGFTGRCYCGAHRLRAAETPQAVTYCHCSDCKRVTAAPLPAFAAFAEGSVAITPALDPAKPVTPGVTRHFCPDCGSQLTARFDYLPDQVYVPLGILDQAANLEPSLHCHADSVFPWLHLDDDLPRSAASGRDILQSR